ncbi:MAG: 50S ribosomal protein L25 [Bacteroidota bacterium]
MQVVALEGSVRENLGKKAAASARKQGQIPCVLYGGKEVHHFTTTNNAVKSLIYTSDFKLAELSIGGTTTKCFVKDVQFHPVSDKITHIDFLELVPGQTVNVEVPVRFEVHRQGLK